LYTRSALSIDSYCSVKIEVKFIYTQYTFLYMYIPFFVKLKYTSKYHNADLLNFLAVSDSLGIKLLTDAAMKGWTNFLNKPEIEHCNSLFLLKNYHTDWIFMLWTSSVNRVDKRWNCVFWLQQRKEEVIKIVNWCSNEGLNKFPK
jgi:hypothetical protein